MLENYCEKLISILNDIKNSQSEKIRKAANMVAKVIENDGIIYIFGCGHSHFIGLDCFYRAGGLANVCAMLEEDLMLHISASNSSKLEKTKDIAEGVFKKYNITKNDILFVISTSGKNAVPCEMALTAKKYGIPTVSVVSGAYFNDKSDTKKLYECTDMFIDNCVPHGDAVMDITGSAVKMGSVSTVASSFIMQSVLLEAAEIVAAKGIQAPIYMSGNIEGGTEYNRQLIEKYKPRVKHL